LDNTAADGAEGIQTLLNIVDELEYSFGVSKKWCSDAKTNLKEAKRYFKTEYRQHCRAKSSQCPDHCRMFALSDQSENCFAGECLHEHNEICANCEALQETIKSVEQKIHEVSSNMYSKEQHDDMMYDFVQAVNNILEWKAHIIRAENQDEGKQLVLTSLDKDSALILMDWAMKFNQMKYREKQSDWFAKRGISWHVSSVITKDNDGLLQVSYFAHLFNNCTQDWFAVTSLLEHLLSSIRETVKPSLTRVILRSDEAGCYHNSNLYSAAVDVGRYMGVAVEGYDHSEPQFGKDITDRIICPLKGALRRYCNEGNDILCAEDMYKALKERPVKGTTATVCSYSEDNKDLVINKFPGSSAYHNFRFSEEGVRVWKAFGIGPGKIISWNDIYVHHQSPTNLTIHEGHYFFPLAVRNLELRQKQVSKISGDEVESNLFKCQETNCQATFNTIDEVEDHLSFFDHSTCKSENESLFDTLRRDWVERFASVTIAGTSAIETERPSSTSASTCSRIKLHQGWALSKRRTNTRFSENVRKYLTAKYDIGERTGQKADALQVSKDLRKALREDGERLYTKNEWLSKSQIQVFFLTNGSITTKTT